MKILGIDSSAKSASAAVTEDKKIITQFYINTGLTHSHTLMPMVEYALKCADISLDEIDLFAVNKGPGSFTGIRIGVAAVKGLADIKNKPCIGVSTLESMAYNLIDNDCIACCVMDARCSQVYSALFDIESGKITRITDDEAISIDDLGERISKYNKKIILVGDGAEICFDALSSGIKNISRAGEYTEFQNACGTCFYAFDHQNEQIKSSELVPEYLRLPQAQRNLKKQ